MKKSKKVVKNSWIEKIKNTVKFNSSKHQPYQPVFRPWALQNMKKFFCKKQSPSFKHQGGKGLFILDAARKAQEIGHYEN